MKIYQPADLYFHPLGERRYSVTLTVPGGQNATSELTLPNSTDFDQLLARLPSGDLGRGALLQLGAELYRALFANDLAAIFSGARTRVGPGQALRLRLHIDIKRTPELAALPWEYLFSPNDQLPLVLHDIPLTRCVGQPANGFRPIEQPLRVLLTAAAAPPAGASAARELAVVQAALGTLGNRVQLIVEPHLTKELFTSYLREEIHIWHFVGHGGLADDGGFLQFEDASSPGDAEPIPAHWLVAALAANPPSLVVLDACDTGRIASREAIWSVAPALVQGAVPAVVAMQLPVADEAARAFASEFYTELARGQIVEACVNAGRRALVMQTKSLRADWGIPVVYTRGGWAERPAPDAPTEPMARGFRALSQLLRTPEVLAISSAVFGSRSAMRLVRKQITDLTEYKEMHDRLHEIQDSFNTIAVNRDRISAEPRAWIEIARNEPELYRRIDSALDTASQSVALRTRAARLRPLDDARMTLRGAMQERDQSRFNQAIEGIRTVLESEPYRINVGLVQRAGDLMLGELAGELEQIWRHRPALAFDDASSLLTDFRTGLDALQNLNRRLAELVHDHNLFQELDLELHRADAEAQRDMQLFARSWQRGLRQQSSELCESGAPWAADLRRCIADLDQAVGTGDTYLMTIMFERHRSQAEQSFNRTDKDIRDICRLLTDTGREIDRLLEQITQ